MEIRIDCKYDELVNLEDIQRHPRNTNMHPIEQIEKFVRMMETNPVWRVPVIISKRSNFLVAGEGRLDFAHALHMEKIPVVYQDFDSEKEEVIFITANNEASRHSKTNRHAVHELMEEFGFNFDDVAMNDFNAEKLEADDLSDKNAEIDTDNFGNDLQHTCPKCGFEFNG